MLSFILPRPHRLELGGAVWLVSQLRLRDVAYLESVRVDPLALLWCGLEDAKAIEDRETRHDALRAIYDQAEQLSLGNTPIDQGDTTVIEAWLSLSREPQPALDGATMTLADTETLLSTMSVPEIRVLLSLAWSLDPLDMIQAAIDAEIGVALKPFRPRPPNGGWSKAVLSIAESLGWTLAEVADLTIGQWKQLSWLGEGKGPEHPIAHGTGGVLDDDGRAKRREFFRDYWEALRKAKASVPNSEEASSPVLPDTSLEESSLESSAHASPEPDAPGNPPIANLGPGRA